MLDEQRRFQFLEGTYEAVVSFANNEFETLTRKVIYRFQRIGASGIYGDAYIYRTLWDEFCHEVQEGPYDPLVYAWEQTLDVLMDDVVERIPRQVAVLLSIYAIHELSDDDEPDLVGAVWPDGMKQVLQESVFAQAGARNLHRLGPWRNG